MTRTRPVLLILLLVLVTARPAGADDRTRMALARSWAGKGDALLGKGRPAEAETAFRKAIESEPTFPGGYLGLGGALVGQQRFTEALAALEEAKEHYIAWEKRSRESEMQLRQEAAQQARDFADLQRAQASKSGPPQPGSPQQAASPMANLAATRMATEDYLVRRGWKLESFQAIPAQVFYLTGLSFLRTGAREAGVAELRACLALQPGHALANYNLAVALFTGGDVLAAKQHLDAAVAAGVQPNPRFAADLESAARSLPAGVPPK